MSVQVPSKPLISEKLLGSVPMKNFNSTTLESIILQSRSQISFIEGLLPGSEFTLLYRGSRDGWMGEVFHDKCDDIGPTLTLVKTSKGRICGGYTSLSWTSTYGIHQKDNSCFLFSVNLLRKYPVIKDDENAVFHYSEYGPCFGNGNLGLSRDQMNSENGGVSSIGCSCIIPADENGNSELTGEGGLNNNGRFTCVELEVFLVSRSD